MASYDVNPDAVAHARRLIDSRQYVLDSDWGDVQPNAEAENAYLEKHPFEDYAAWHLGLTEGANEGTKARHAFVYGDLRRVHRSGLIAAPEEDLLDLPDPASLPHRSDAKPRSDAKRGADISA